MLPRCANYSAKEFATILQMEKIKLKNISDSRGNLVSIESDKSIPWAFKRVYYLYGLNNEPRGFHAHKKLKQFLICLNGSCEVKLDNGSELKTIKLERPDEGIFINEMIWHEMYNFSKDCVVMVLADDYYDESDYIRDYAKFKTHLSTRE